MASKPSSPQSASIDSPELALVSSGGAVLSPSEGWQLSESGSPLSQPEPLPSRILGSVGESFQLEVLSFQRGESIKQLSAPAFVSPPAGVIVPKSRKKGVASLAPVFISSSFAGVIVAKPQKQEFSIQVPVSLLSSDVGEKEKSFAVVPGKVVASGILAARPRVQAKYVGVSEENVVDKLDRKASSMVEAFDEAHIEYRWFEGLWLDAITANPHPDEDAQEHILTLEGNMRDLMMSMLTMGNVNDCVEVYGTLVKENEVQVDASIAVAYSNFKMDLKLIAFAKLEEKYATDLAFLEWVYQDVLARLKDSIINNFSSAPQMAVKIDGQQYSPGESLRYFLGKAVGLQERIIALQSIAQLKAIRETIAAQLEHYSSKEDAFWYHSSREATFWRKFYKGFLGHYDNELAIRSLNGESFE